MIYSDRQCAITKSELEKMRAALDGFGVDGTDLPEWLQKAQSEALCSQIEDLVAELTEYELIKSGKLTYTECNSLSELPRILVIARIAQGLTQKELAEQMGMKAQQVQRYEASNYMSASLATLIQFAEILKVKVSEAWQSDSEIVSGAVFSWKSLADVSWDKFPLKEMVKRNWLEFEKGQNLAETAEAFFRESAGPNFVTAFHRKKFFGSNKPNQYALLAWQARVLGISAHRVHAGKLGEFQHNDTWVPELVELTMLDDGPLHAVKFLAGKGIDVVIEPHLQHTFLDGSAMLSESGNPVIGLTLRHDRLDNFWFVLFHELGHVFLHLFDGLRFDFFDEADGVETDEIEKEADVYALDHLIPSEKWNQCISRFKITADAVIKDANRIGIASSVLAGRIRKENNNYTILENLVGQGGVRALFKE